MTMTDRAAKQSRQPRRRTAVVARPSSLEKYLAVTKAG